MEDKKQSTSTWSKLTAPLYRFFTPNEAVYSLVQEGKAEDVCRLIDKGVDVNCRYIDDTLLATSLRRDRFATTIVLLERGADPNATSAIDGHEKPPIQRAIDLKSKSRVCLLSWYGANSQGLNFTPFPEAESLIAAIAEQVKQRRLLENQLQNSALSNTAKAEVCNKLAQLWQQQATGETQPVYLKHYQDKAASYLQQAQTLGEQREVEYSHLKMD